jgi:hypothetical protein
MTIILHTQNAMLHDIKVKRDGLAPALKGMNIIDVMDAGEYLNNSEAVRLIELSNTTIAGYPAMQSTYYQSTYISNLKAMETTALTNNSAEQYTIRYITDPGYFNSHLPLVYEMIKSFKIGIE